MVHLDAIHHPTQTNIIRNQIRLLRLGQHIMATTRRPRRSSSRAPESGHWVSVSLLLAAGQKGLRFALPNARILVHQPKGGLRGPSDRHHAARSGDSKSQEAAQRDLHEAYRPAAAKDRRGAGARFFYDGRDGQGFRLSRQGNRSSVGDTTACSRVLNGHASSLSPWLEVFTINSCEV